MTVFFAGVPSGANVSAAGVPSSGGTCRRSVQRRHWGDWFLREGGFSHPDQVDAAGHQHNAVEAEPLASAGPQPTGVHIEEEVDFDIPEPHEIETEAEQAEQAEQAALLAFKSKWNLTKSWERGVVKVPELSGDNRIIMEAVLRGERYYLAERQTIKTKHISDMRMSSTPSYCSDPHRQGFRADVSGSRIRDAEAAFGSPSAQAMEAELKKLGAIHYGYLMNIAKQANRETLPAWIPLAPFSITVLRAHSGTRPGIYPGKVEYANIFDALELIKSGKMPGQRTCGKTVVETPIPDTVPCMYNWGPWFLKIGGFEHPDQFDAAGMSPVLHAIDQSLWSKRAAFAARWLIEHSSLDTLEKHSGHEPGYPKGYAPIHLLAGGVDKNNHRPELMRALLDRKVNLESRTRNVKQNTACTLAAAQGCGTMYQILIAAGGDICATTSSGPTIQQFKPGVGQRQAARQSSSKVYAETIAARVPDTNSHRAGARVSHHSIPPSRMLRHGFDNRWQSGVSRSRSKSTRRSQPRFTPR